jgi:predicted outer membrane repeat protein
MSIKTSQKISFIIILLLLATVSIAAADTIFVDTDAIGNNDGSSWDDAYNYLQDALAVASNGDDIRVAQGIYKPDQGSGVTAGDSAATFNLINEVAIKGAYAGSGEPDPHARDIDKYKSVLSGDLAGDDGPNFANIAENSCHVVTAGGVDSTAMLDGFTITGGFGSSGGGIYCTGSPTVTNCTFCGNTAGSGGGGGMYCRGGRPTLMNCAFIGNHSPDGYGGGMYCREANPTLDNCTFINNSANIYGGGMSNTSSSSPTLTNCSFIGNRVFAGYNFGGGGAISNVYHSNPTLINCKFRGNHANLGGAIRNYSDGDTKLVNCIFSGNLAESGGGIYETQSNSNLINCTLVGNTAKEGGGAIFSASESNTKISNCIMWANQATEGNEIYLSSYNGQFPATITVEYSDVKGGSDAVYVGTNCTLNWGIGNIDDDPLLMDPDGADNVLGTEDDNLRLLPGSPCIDKGDNSAVPSSVSTDLDGNPRITNNVVDMGAYEGPGRGFLLSADSLDINEASTATFSVALAIDPLATVEVTVARASGDTDITVNTGEVLTFDSSDYSVPQNVTLTASEDADNFDGSAIIMVQSQDYIPAGITANEVDNEPNPNILFVDADAAGAATGASWTDALNNLQEALGIAAANTGIDEIRVAQGLYKPAGPGGDRNATFRLINGLAVKGGYAGFDEPDPDDRDIDKYQTILSADLNGEDELYELSNAENCYHVATAMFADETAVLEGFTITGANANGSSDTSGSGGGFYNSFSSNPTVTKCKFSKNSAIFDGGGFFNRYSRPTLSGCTFIGNWAGRRGGAMENNYGFPVVNRCIFIGNSAVYGGAIDSDNMGSGEPHPALTNCIFSGNSAEYGGAVYCPFIAVDFINCTFSRNLAYYGDAIYGDDDTRLQLTNCILWGNNGGSGIGGTDFWPDAYYSCIQGGLNGEGNIDADPLFVDANGPDGTAGTEDDNLRLSADSPCIDAGDPDGDPDYVSEPGETDLDGKPRIIGDRVDMGAYEFRPFISAEVDIKPDSLNIQSKRKWITCYIRLGDGYNVIDIDPDSIVIGDGVKAESLRTNEKKQVAVARFSHIEILHLLKIGQVELTVSGRLTDGTVFEGTDIIIVESKAGGN